MIDQDQSATSQRYLQGYEQSDFFDVMARGSSMTDADEVFATSTAKVAVIIPAGFEGTIEADGHAEVAVLVDGTRPNSARVARSYSVAINQLASTTMTREWAESQGIDVSGVGTLDARIRTWYNRTSGPQTSSSRA